MAASDQNPPTPDFTALRQDLADRLATDMATRRLYANDASIYEQIPCAVAFPSSDADVAILIRFAAENQIGLIPRAAGTSLAGQVVGSGMVVDVSRYLNQIVDIDPENAIVTVRPGVVRDELNRVLRPHGLFFAPETSTSNRATIGGMFGNNSCGANSIQFGTTRDHVLAVRGFLSDATEVYFGPEDCTQFVDKCNAAGIEGVLYRQIRDELSRDTIKAAIVNEYPKTSIHRRNTGLALDRLLQTEPFGGTATFNCAQFLAGSEGTLFFATELKLKCERLSDIRWTGLVCPHFSSVRHAVEATQLMMQWSPQRCELIDDHVIDGAQMNTSQSENANFIIGQPKAILMVEYTAASEKELAAKISQIATCVKAQTETHHCPVLHGDSAEKAWRLRKAGLGVLHNRPQLRRPVTVIEDAAVDLADYPSFLDEIREFLERQKIDCVFYGHIGAGELHLRPYLDLSNPDDARLLRSLAEKMSQLVKKYRGSLSGEHGDGRLRSEFIESQIGAECYQLICRIKKTWDPDNVFNPGKIFEPTPMDRDLTPRSTAARAVDSVFHYRRQNGFSFAATACSGSGDCLKSHWAGGVMCPSFQATAKESASTRGRANLLRQLISGTNGPRINDDSDPKSEFGAEAQPLFDRDELNEVADAMELCLSCKACQSECPSNVDMAKLKSEVQQMVYDQNGTPLRVRLLSNFDKHCQRFGLKATFNLLRKNRWTASIIKRIAGIAGERALPRLSTPSFRKWFDRRIHHSGRKSKRSVVIICDEFTNHLDTQIGIAAVELLEGLGYDVDLSPAIDSGRSAISCGQIRHAKQISEANVATLAPFLKTDAMIVGLEPSACLTFRDEYVDLVDDQYLTAAEQLAENVLLFDEFIAAEISAGNIAADQFLQQNRPVYLHRHCHHKALSSPNHFLTTLRLCGANVQEIRSGCCGMAGFFGYQRDKYRLSMQIGELTLFPTINQCAEDAILVSDGHSCRHQIADGTGRRALHPAELLKQQLR